MTTSRLYEDIRRITGEEITPSELAKAINESVQTVNNWTSRGVSSEGLIKCAVAFYGLDIYYIKLGERKVIKHDRRVSNLTNVSLSDLLNTTDPVREMGKKLLEVFLSLNLHNQELIQLIANKMYEYDHPNDKRANGKKSKMKEEQQ